MTFENVSVIIPTLRETEDFLQTLTTILNTCEAPDIKEIIVVVCKATTEESFSFIEKGRQLAETRDISYNVLFQTRPYLGGALMDGFQIATGSHVVVETADLNTAPENLAKMIELAKKYPNDIISSSRWMKGSSFENYPAVKKVWNYFSQLFLRVLYFTKVTDFTWGTHLAPTVLYQAINFQENRHPIAVEEVVIPLRLGVKIHEIPGTCHVKLDDTSVQPLWANLLYLRPAFKWRFASKRKMLRHDMNIDDLE